MENDRTVELAKKWGAKTGKVLGGVIVFGMLWGMVHALAEMSQFVADWATGGSFPEPTYLITLYLTAIPMLLRGVLRAIFKEAK